MVDRVGMLDFHGREYFKTEKSPTKSHGLQLDWTSLHQLSASPTWWFGYLARKFHPGQLCRLAWLPANMTGRSKKTRGCPPPIGINPDSFLSMQISLFFIKKQHLLFLFQNKRFFFLCFFPTPKWHSLISDFTSSLRMTFCFSACRSWISPRLIITTWWFGFPTHRSDPTCSLIGFSRGGGDSPDLP